MQATSIVEVHLVKGKFVPAQVHVPPHSVLRLVNDSNEMYTVEGAGALPGDIIVPAHQRRDVPLGTNPGAFYAVIEEYPSSELHLDMEGDPDAGPPLGETPFDAARPLHRQPLFAEPGHEPAYGAYTAFDIVGKGEDAQQEILRKLYLLQEALSGEKPPAEFALYFPADDWKNFRTSIALVYALGPGAYSGDRFGPRIAAAEPADLNPISYAARLTSTPRQHDILVRVTSDRHWFNLRAIRWVWRELGPRIKNATMDSGYGNPNGRSPILGGFFDGTGNPFGDKREETVFGDHHGNGTYLAWFRIRFDEAGFRARTLAKQQKIVGRERQVGRPLPGAPDAAHKNRAGADPEVAILRQPFVFDDGTNGTGLLFASLQASPKTLERMLSGFMMGSKKPSKDSLMSFMRFEAAALYYVPSSPPGSFPGSLRYGGR